MNFSTNWRRPDDVVPGESPWSAAKVISVLPLRRSRGPSWSLADSSSSGSSSSFCSAWASHELLCVTGCSSEGVVQVKNFGIVRGAVAGFSCHQRALIFSKSGARHVGYIVFVDNDALGGDLLEHLAHGLLACC